MGKHKVVVGLGFGDEGKGTTVDYLTSEEPYDFVLRFSGGPQAAHNVKTTDGRHHTFTQFGSGSFNHVPTILTKYMMINPLSMAEEAHALEQKIGVDPFNLLTISENSLLVTPWHWAINQVEEIRRGDNAHGSCGQGVGVTQKFALDYPDLALRAKDMLLDADSFVAKAMIVRELLKAEYGWPTKEEFQKLERYVQVDLQRSPGNIQCLFKFFMYDHMPIIMSDDEILNLIKDSNCVWEGSQGVLLDEWVGFHPYTTWSTTTSENALQLLSEAGVPRTDVEVIGVSRTYHTRHGHGPFPSEDPRLDDEFPEEFNKAGKFQGGWRVGALDLSMVEYSIESDGEIDSLSLTHADMDKFYVTRSFRYGLKAKKGDLVHQEKLTSILSDSSLSYKWESASVDLVVDQLEKVSGLPVSILSFGPTAGDKVRVDSHMNSMVE